MKAKVIRLVFSGGFQKNLFHQKLFSYGSPIYLEGEY